MPAFGIFDCNNMYFDTADQVLDKFNKIGLIKNQ